MNRIIIFLFILTLIFIIASTGYLIAIDYNPHEIPTKILEEGYHDR